VILWSLVIWIWNLHPTLILVNCKSISFYEAINNNRYVFESIINVLILHNYIWIIVIELNNLKTIDKLVEWHYKKNMVIELKWSHEIFHCFLENKINCLQDVFLKKLLAQHWLYATHAHVEYLFIFESLEIVRMNLCISNSPFDFNMLCKMQASTN
jgi:hypothetical protein